MSRAALIAELDAYAAGDERERAMVAACARFVRERADCFERAAPGGHITASAWILDGDFTCALLTHHRKLNRWLQLGGHADGDDDVRRVALREAREESGLSTIVFAQAAIYDVDVHAIPAHGRDRAHLHYDIRFAFVADRTEATVVSDESHELAWRRVADLVTPGSDESVRRLARKTERLRPNTGRLADHRITEA